MKMPSAQGPIDRIDLLDSVFPRPQDVQGDTLPTGGRDEPLQPMHLLGGSRPGEEVLDNGLHEGRLAATHMYEEVPEAEDRVQHLLRAVTEQGGGPVELLANGRPPEALPVPRLHRVPRRLWHALRLGDHLPPLR
jgi:hypothetical protein